MLLSFNQLLWLQLPFLVKAATVTYSVPLSVPTGAATLDSAPVGISFEFFAFPAYFTNVTATNQCLKNFQNVTGIWPPIRIGGTTQDRAKYDASSSVPVVYSVAAPTDAPANLTFGPSFMSLAATYLGTVVLGLNRGKDDITNTISAAKVAKETMKNLLAIELGNEPEYYLGGGQPIAVKAGTWDPPTDAQSQNNWIQDVGTALGTTLIQAGNHNESPPKWGAEELISTQNDTVKSYVRTYAHHNYPGGKVPALMSHAGISSNLNIFKGDLAAAATTGKEYVLGETNSQSGGGAKDVSPLFGAALWTMDYVLRASSINIKRTYFHHGTVGLCFYCWWGRFSMGAPYYGAYAATTAMAGGKSIAALDNGTTSDAVYVIYDGVGKPLKMVLYNSAYFSGTGTRGNQTFALEGLQSASIGAKRLTAANAGTRVDSGGGVVTFGGETFAHGTCIPGGNRTIETTAVVDGKAAFVVAASEALVLFLQ
ncbi:hypothetical protein VTL71DRAFT_7633 [Oculimacula yallundae]|uniref:Beta-glucuronidase C-terminal domain-containing protein n=1 Tax=Oculimacula yallundae TaxID=86028 RepID=A0ABR4BUN8_9HELO